MENSKEGLHRFPPLATVRISSFDELSAMTLAAMVMAAVDDYIDEDELSLIQAFVQYHWHPDFGDLSAFMVDADRQLADFLFSEGNNLDFDNCRDKFFLDLVPRLSPQHQKDLVTLMELVMDADGIREAEELSLLRILSRHLT